MPKKWPEVVLKRPFISRKFWESPSSILTQTWLNSSNLNLLSCNLTLKPPQIMNVGWQDQHPHFKKLPSESCKDLFLYAMQKSVMVRSLAKNQNTQRKSFYFIFCSCDVLITSTHTQIFISLSFSLSWIKMFSLNMFIIFVQKAN